MSEYVVYLPEIQTAALTPNPVNINSQFVISIKVTEIQKTLEPEIWCSSEIYSGEV